MKNKEVLESLLRGPSLSAPPTPKPTYNPIVNPNTYPARDSTERLPSQPNTVAYTHNYVPKADKFRTVPCKYYHSQQGCSKIDNCTFIHDEKYAGQPIPPPSSQPGRYGFSNNPVSNYPSYQPISSIPSGMSSGMAPGGNYSINKGYYSQPMPYGGNPSYYNPNMPNQNYPNTLVGGYSMQPQASNPYMQGQQVQQQVQQQIQQQYNNVNPQGYNSNPNFQYYIGKGPVK